MSLNARRRSLLGGEKDLLYRLEHRAIDREIVSTGVKTLAPGLSVTILMDVSVTSNLTSGDGRLWKLIAQYNSVLSKRGIYVGKASASNQALSVWWNTGTYVSLSGSSTGAGRHRIAVTHAADSDDLTVYYKKENGTLQTQSFTNTFAPDTAASLNFGSTGDNLLPVGTINLAEVWGRVLSSEELRAFFK